MPALERDLLLRPKLDEKREAFRQPAGAVAQVEAKSGELLGAPALGDGEHRPAIAHRVQRGNLLGKLDGVMEGQEHDGPKAQMTCLSSEPGQGDEVLEPRLRIAEVVLAQPDRVEAQITCCPDQHEAFGKLGPLASAPGPRPQTAPHRRAYVPPRARLMPAALRRLSTGLVRPPHAVGWQVALRRAGVLHAFDLPDPHAAQDLLHRVGDDSWHQRQRGDRRHL